MFVVLIALHNQKLTANFRNEQKIMNERDPNFLTA